ncbi:MAG TPA: helix-turn-helix domain-containing protein [Candidatus Norongarragalinales archaeon]|nr:helix-turn-helix domain-containing protein [Candidatus Norongarragalinales archaeon]
MWVAEFKLKREKSVLIAATAKYNVNIASYYLNVYSHKGRAFVNKVSLVQGPDKAQYIKLLVSHMAEKVRTVEGNQVFYQHEGMDAFNAQVMNSEVIFLRPIIGKGGFEYWTIASWSKSNLHELERKIARMKGVKIWLLSLHEEPVDIFLPNVFEHLSKKQREAIEKAASLGYYEFPRKISAQDIAKKEGVDESTFREHLRKAEMKIIKAAVRQAL